MENFFGVEGCLYGSWLGFSEVRVRITRLLVDNFFEPRFSYHC